MTEKPFEKLVSLTPEKIDKLHMFADILRSENERVNLLSRKDMDDVEYRHIALCAAIGEFFKPHDGARLADVGTGGGLPGIVMAILWPKCKISMFDGVGKKIKMVEESIEKLGLQNASAHHARIEEYRGLFDYAVGRSVCALPMFLDFVKHKLTRGNKGTLSNGVIYFKGGELEPELAQKRIFPDAQLDLQKFFDDERFEGKRLIHIPTQFCA